MYAHAVVLANRCPWLAKLIDSAMQNSGGAPLTKVVVGGDGDSSSDECWAKVLEFIYTDDLDVKGFSAELLKEVEALAGKLELAKLVQICKVSIDGVMVWRVVL